MSDDKKKGKDLNFEGLNSSFAELMKEILEDEPDYLSASDIDKALGVSPESNDPIFIGTYSCEISRGKIALPIKHIAVWAIAETFEDDNCVSCGKHGYFFQMICQDFRMTTLKLFLTASVKLIAEDCGRCPIALFNFLVPKS